MGHKHSHHQNHEKKSSSKNWFDLPFEMREMVIDRMDEKTRCRFAQCSKMCEEEAKESDNYLYSIRVYERRKDVLALDVTFDEHYVSRYSLEFMDADHNETIVLYRSKRSNEISTKWAKVESGNSKDVRTKYVKEYLEKYKNNIKYFIFQGDYDMLNDFNLDNLRKLNEIDLFSIPVELGKVLKLENGFIQMNKLLKVDRIYIEEAKFTFDQIVQFKGKEAIIASDEFTEENIKKYLKMWKNGEIHENVEFVEVLIDPLGNVTLRNITEGLDVHGYRNFSDSECVFYSKCNLRENKKFRVSFQTRGQLTVEWIQ